MFIKVLLLSDGNEHIVLFSCFFAVGLEKKFLNNINGDACNKEIDAQQGYLLVKKNSIYVKLFMRKCFK